MKEILNVKVKHRESFRPFAPVVCHEDAAVYFEIDDPLPEPTDYMLIVYPVREHYRARVPAIVHVDGSGRSDVCGAGLRGIAVYSRAVLGLYKTPLCYTVPPWPDWAGFVVYAGFFVFAAFMRRDLLCSSNFQQNSNPPATSRRL